MLLPLLYFQPRNLSSLLPLSFSYKHEILIYKKKNKRGEQREMVLLAVTNINIGDFLFRAGAFQNWSHASYI